MVGLEIVFQIRPPVEVFIYDENFCHVYSSLVRRPACPTGYRPMKGFFMGLCEQVIFRNVPQALRCSHG